MNVRVYIAIRLGMSEVGTGMESRDALPIARTRQSGSYQERLAWIAVLARDGLHAVNREDLRLELRYAPDVATRVREMVRKEQECCGFLNFDLTETEEDVRLTITAPQRARQVADMLFEQFVPFAVSKAMRARQQTDTLMTKGEESWLA
jgi:hypothetical protein